MDGHLKTVDHRVGLHGRKYDLHPSIEQNNFKFQDSVTTEITGTHRSLLAEAKTRR